MRDVTGTTGPGRSGGELLQIFGGRGGYFKVVVRGDDLSFVIVTGEAQGGRCAVGHSQKTVGGIALDLFFAFIGKRDGVPAMNIMAGKTLNLAGGIFGSIR